MKCGGPDSNRRTPTGMDPESIFPENSGMKIPKILQMYLSCHTEEEIGKELDIALGTVHNVIEGFFKNSEIVKSCNEPPSSLQITTLWSFDACDPSYGEKGYPGRMPW